MIFMNLCLIFINEPIDTNRQAKQRENDKIISDKIKSIYNY